MSQLLYEAPVPNSVDIAVGRNIRLHRLRLKFSQELLASKIGVTFQQVQKYEKGTNRVGASRLSMIAGVLRIPITSLFDGAAAGASSESENHFRTLLTSAQVIRLIEAFSAIPSTRVRQSVVKLVEGISQSRESD